MKNVKFISLAAAVTAMVLTLSCSSDDDGGGGSSSSSEGSQGSVSNSSGGGLSSSTLGISSSSGGGGGDGGKPYRIVEIGTQTWMAENLNYAVAGSKCYGEGGEVLIGYDEDNNPITKTLSPAEVQANCDKYGRLYDWSTAMNLPSSCNSDFCSSQINSPHHQGICPAGWHIPSRDDWDELFRFVDIDNGGEGDDRDNSAGRYLKAATSWNYNSENNSDGNGTDNYGFSALSSGRGGFFSDFPDGIIFHAISDRSYWWCADEDDTVDSSCYGYIYYNGEYARSSNLFKSYLFSVRCVQD
ncbi:MAG: hypothetical protein LBQ76_09505 [Candidatus Fibromonas sp.]|nr:hypothetical protein [Candidatus Fibromonas sp.]